MKTNNQPLRSILLLFFLIPIFRLSAEPLNVMVEDLTFARPEKWRWAEPTANSPAVTRFLVPDTRGDTSSIDVRFYVIKKDYSNERASLKAQFPEAKADDLHEQELKIGQRKIVYFEIAGAYTYHDHPSKKDQMVVGAAMPLGKEYIYARIQGARTEVEGQVAIFKKMVEDAVKEREADLGEN